ncbi:MAG: SH3 domain-containing protein [Tunicatimonas sp.]
MKKYLTLILLVFEFQSYGQLIHDDSYLDLDFWKFKSELVSIVLEEDTARLRKMLADRILESNDGCGYPGCTKDEFIKYYFSESSEITWNNMQKILRFGFSRIEDKNPDSIVPHEKTVFKGPSYLETVDTENELIILGEQVNIREKPNLKSEVIEQASFEKFKCDCNILTMTDTTYQRVDEIGWIEIKLNNGKVGYVASEFTSYGLIKEMTVAKIDGKWKIISFYQAPGC